MTEDFVSDRARFYLERDSRTSEYVESDSLVTTPVSIHVSTDACETRSGQLLLQTLVNQLARIHRELRFVVAVPDTALLTPALCGSSTLGDEIVRLAHRIDPFGKFELDTAPASSEDISIGIGAYCRRDLAWYLGFDRSNANLDTEPCRAGSNTPADLRGASLAATLGAAAAAKEALSFETVPTVLSAWNLRSGVEADPGPAELPPIDVGQGLMIGAGAVAAAAVYWLVQWGNVSPWTIVDHDRVELHNTNRGLLFFPEDAGWPRAVSAPKVARLSSYLPSAVAVDAWYDEADVSKQTFDTVLVLANERDVRSIVSARNDPIQLQATTGQSWLSQLHRHISGRDDCARCRTADIRAPQLACSAASTATNDQPERPDAALPFLSAASGLMLVSALQHLQHGDIGKEKTNIWNWDFRNLRRMDRAFHCSCRDDCSMALSLNARHQIAQATRWADQPWTM